MKPLTPTREYEASLALDRTMADCRQRYADWVAVTRVGQILRHCSEQLRMRPALLVDIPLPLGLDALHEAYATFLRIHYRSPKQLLLCEAQWQALRTALPRFDKDAHCGELLTGPELTPTTEVFGMAIKILPTTLVGGDNDVWLLGAVEVVEYSTPTHSVCDTLTDGHNVEASVGTMVVQCEFIKALFKVK